jgi:hypothetical protein
MNYGLRAMGYGLNQLNRNRIQRFVLFFSFALLFAVCRIHGFDEALPAQSKDASLPTPQDTCIVCHQKNADETIELFAHSTHSRRSISCKECHGGNASASEKQAAHSQNFTGKMTSNQILERCGSCHKSQLTTFQNSRHYPVHKNMARVDCVQCHGAHTVGKLQGDSNFVYVCAGCHGLEYLPGLPSPLQKTLDMTDEIRNLWRDLEGKGAKPTEEIVKLRRELRHEVGEWVHATDVKGAQENAAKFFEMGERLKKLLTESRK